jgi:hypothetical protein
MHLERHSNYYNHSNQLSTPRRSAWAPLSACALGAVLCVACGASNNQIARSARRVPVAHFSELPPAERAKALESLPVILEIRKGDTFPVEALLESRLLTLHTEGAWTVEARQTFYVLLREEGAPVVSTDGIHFDEPEKNKNSFGVGIDSQKDQPAKVRVALRWHASEGATP